ncbi:endonuclease domain-containing protein [Microbacterium telephonicum]|uniref:Very-short-patch-repair endonuclease n=1 Tax=Microbacterium telephonicum TaxID=1714841 RepID=A0A498BZV7_9MICO|nr:DUF559 domain-containing protein [Microbacterium telephonicum]RLK47796.1 very-short-patch-repair endonuclease [Microbacterium telephonicum]
MFRIAKLSAFLPADVPPACLERSELIAQGVTPRAITTAIRLGMLLRPRRGRYLPAGTRQDLHEAVRLGGRLDCVSLLAICGVFVQAADALHFQLDPDSTRVPTPGPAVVRHWRPTAAGPTAVLTDPVEALAQAVLCQAPRAAIATLDSAWHLGFVDAVGIAEVFTRLPRRYRRLRALLDPRAESGTETLVRLILRTLGCSFDLQVEIGTVGRVDFVVDGWLIVECDSAAHHGDWAARKRDIRRDAAAARLGFTTVRLLAEDILHRPDEVAATLRDALAHGAPRTRRP